MNSDKVDPDTELLCQNDANTNVFVTRHQHSIGHRPISCQFGHIRNNESINAFLFARRIHLPKPNLNIGGIGQSSLFGCRAPEAHCIIPINAEQRQVRL